MRTTLFLWVTESDDHVPMPTLFSDLFKCVTVPEDLQICILLCSVTRYLIVLTHDSLEIHSTMVSTLADLLTEGMRRWPLDRYSLVFSGRMPVGLPRLAQVLRDTQRDFDFVASEQARFINESTVMLLQGYVQYLVGCRGPAPEAGFTLKELLRLYRVGPDTVSVIKEISVLELCKMPNVVVSAPPG